jgi:Fic family protein
VSVDTPSLAPLPPPIDLETVPILKALATATRGLAELKGLAAAIPNQQTLIDTLTLQEARASSEIENIVTTQDELFRAGMEANGAGSPAAKEVARYREALHLGHDRLRGQQGILTNRTLIEMFRVLKQSSAGFRTLPGTVLQNQATGEIVHTPPQSADEVQEHMTALERFVNDDSLSPLDPLVKMALIHHQFETIHPFYDGNGRIGRILNVLYLTRTGLLDQPILYLSRHITRTKSDYYRLLRAVRSDGAWEDWVLYMLRGVADTAHVTLRLIEGIREQMAAVKQRMRAELPRLYSRDLLNNLFRHPYTRTAFVQNDLGVSRVTAARYLEQLTEHGFVRKLRAGRNNYYIHTDLVNLFVETSGD